MPGSALTEKSERLDALLREMGSVLVAFSAGADSTLLACCARRALGDRALAVTGRSVTLARAELEQAADLARRIGIRHRVVDTDEIADPAFGNNPPDRCYFCKSELYGVLRRVADEEGIAHIADGANADDAADHRPGMRAAREREVRSPLMEAGLTKREVRELSRALGLPTWDKPAQACLSSRFPYGDAITPEKIAQVERAEAALRGLGFRQLRVRHHGTIARIEIPREEFGALFADGLADRVAACVKEAGFTYVALDLEGFRSGSMNEALRAAPGSGLAILP